MTVLLVDDNEINLEIQKYMLENCDLSVDTAISGDQAVSLARTNHYDLIFMDIQMPGMDGFTAAEHIRKFNGSVPVIALSADKVSNRDSRFISAGMNGSLSKPLQMNDLNEILSSYLHVSENSDIPQKNDNVIFDFASFSALVSEPDAEMRILTQFLSVHERDCDVLRERIKAENILGARELMHDIVGISGNLCCNRLYDVSTRLGAELRQGCSDSLGDFSEVWELTIGEIREYCGKIDSHEHGHCHDHRDWNVLWQDFFSLCDEFDVAAVRLFYANISDFSDNLSEPVFKRLRSAVDRYDFLAIINDKEGFDV